MQPANLSVGPLAPVAALCGTYNTVIAFSVGQNAFTGTLVAKYARTWKLVVYGPGMSVGDGPTYGQVWRFLVNGELSTSPVDQGSCPVPACVGSGIPTHWVGNLDFACANVDGGPPTWSFVASLSHLPGVIAHNSATVPSRVVPSGMDHATTSYHLVSPAAFTWFAPPPDAAPPEAPLQGIYGQGVRFEPQYGACTRREVGFLPSPGNYALDAFSYCGAAPGSGSPGWWDIQLGPLQTYGGAANAEIESIACGSSWPGGYVPASSPPPPAPPLPSSGIEGIALGVWNDISAYPFIQRLSLYWGCVAHRDPCGTFGVQRQLEVVTGVATDDRPLYGNPLDMEVFPFSPGNCCFVATVMMDLQNAGLPFNMNWGGPFVPTVTIGLVWEAGL